MIEPQVQPKFRRCFWVDPSVEVTTTRDGSILAPFATLADAIHALPTADSYETADIARNSMPIIKLMPGAPQSITLDRPCVIQGMHHLSRLDNIYYETPIFELRDLEVGTLEDVSLQEITLGIVRNCSIDNLDLIVADDGFFAMKDSEVGTTLAVAAGTDASVSLLRCDAAGITCGDLTLKLCTVGTLTTDGTVAATFCAIATPTGTINYSGEYVAPAPEG